MMVSEISHQYQIQPELRLYLQPGSIQRTSSNKIQRPQSKQLLLDPSFRKTILCYPDNPFGFQKAS